MAKKQIKFDNIAESQYLQYWTTTISQYFVVFLQTLLSIIIFEYCNITISLILVTIALYRSIVI